MSISDATDEQAAGTRAGGNVETKGASQSGGGAGEAATRAGGNVETKGASGGDDDAEETAE